MTLGEADTDQTTADHTQPAPMERAWPPAHFSDLRCLVVGGASGIGLATVERLAPKVKGLVTADIQLPLTSTDGVSALHIDVTNEASVAQAFQESADLLGGIDVVVNTSGILGEVQPSMQETPADFERLIRVNLLGAFLVSQAALPCLVRSASGRLVHFSSTAGKEGVAQMAGYSASKAGVMGLVKSLAREYAHTGVTVNAVAPGKISTPFVKHTPPSVQDLARIPLGRLGTAEEVAALVEYIVSPEASYHTGVVFDSSGGRATW